MSLYAIGDLHLCFGVPSKTMSIFSGWEDYQERIEENWKKTVGDGDTVVIVGDFSWGMSLEQALPDFEFIEKLPGSKIVLKGNHDYWWTTKKKMEDFFALHNIESVKILHNNHYRYENIGICGTRGWVSISGEVQDEKVLKREEQRLECSINSALAENLEPVVFIHYPPVFASGVNYGILDILYKYGVSDCYYGHIHGRSAHNLCVKGTSDGLNFHLVSGDYLQFVPEKVK